MVFFALLDRFQPIILAAEHGNLILGNFFDRLPALSIFPEKASLLRDDDRRVLEVGQRILHQDRDQPPGQQIKIAAELGGAQSFQGGRVLRYDDDRSFIRSGARDQPDDHK